MKTEAEHSLQNQLALDNGSWRSLITQSFWEKEFEVKSEVNYQGRRSVVKIGGPNSLFSTILFSLPSLPLRSTAP